MANDVAGEGAEQVAAAKKAQTRRKTSKRRGNKATTKGGGRKKKKVIRPYPTVPLEEALEIALQIKEKNAGNPWTPEEVAKAVGLSKSNAKFFYMTAASRDFGLTVGTRGASQIALTDLGRELVYAPSSVMEEKLKRRAFLNVAIFRQVLEYYKGSKLPEMKYLGNTLAREFGLDPATHEEFSLLFGENCEFLGIGTGTQLKDVLRGDSQGLERDQEGEPEKPKGTITLAEPEGDSDLLCFVVMPFEEREPTHRRGFFDEVLRSLITPAGRNAKFKVITAYREGSDLIQSTIINDLLDADLVIADLTENNPNVLFELGMRMAHDKPIALIRAKGTAQIFDVDNVLRVWEYDPSLWPSTVQKDLPKLTGHIKAAWEARDTDSTYMKLLRRPKAPKVE